MRFRPRWDRTGLLLTPLLLADCRITADMPLGEKIALGVLDGVLIVAGIFVLMLALYATSSHPR